MKKSYRIKKEKEFQTIIYQKNSYANRYFIVYVSESEKNKHFRVGLSVGKKIGNAVTRNRVKRLMRTVLYDVKEEVSPQANIVFIARPKAAELSYNEVKKNMVHVMGLAHLLK